MPGVVAFGWAERGIVVITRAMAQKIAARYALDPDAVQDWWDRLLAHELELIGAVDQPPPREAGSPRGRHSPRNRAPGSGAHPPGPL